MSFKGEERFYPNDFLGYELTTEEKSRVSHRGRALNEMKQEFDRVLIWIRRHMPSG